MNNVVTRYKDIADIIRDFESYGFAVKFGRFKDGTENIIFKFVNVDEHCIYNNVAEDVARLTGYDTYYFSVDDKGVAELVFY